MSNNDERYGINKNLWRRVYGRTRRKPRVVEYFDSGSQANVSRDLNKTYRHRDYFSVQGINRRTVLFTTPTGSVSGSEYEEGLIAFAGETELTANFVSAFSSNPYVVYTVDDPGDDSGNINVFGTALPSTTQMFVGLSAPFTGNIRYRAAYAPTWPRSATSAYTGSMTIEAGAINITNATTYTASYTLDPGTIEFRATFHDSLSNNQANTGLINDSTSNTTSTNSLTAQSSGQIHFIAFRL